jgi:hypothetical protein
MSDRIATYECYRGIELDMSQPAEQLADVRAEIDHVVSTDDVEKLCIYAASPAFPAEARGYAASKAARIILGGKRPTARLVRTRR